MYTRQGQDKNIHTFLMKNLYQFDGFVGFRLDTNSNLVITKSWYGGKVINEELEKLIEILFINYHPDSLDDIRMDMEEGTIPPYGVTYLGSKIPVELPDNTTSVIFSGLKNSIAKYASRKEELE